VLIALGGGVLIGMTFALFRAIGINAEPLVGGWIVPCGIAGATVIASWLVEAKQSVIENMAPVLTRIFSPLFALLFLVAQRASRVPFGYFARRMVVEVPFVVFALLLYSFSARDHLARPGLNDWVQMTLVCTALLVDLLALWAVGSRISSFGFTPNRVAALGENVVLLVNLAGSALLYARFLRGRVAFSRLVDWQTTYLYVIAGWAAIVAFIFPLLFRFR